MARDVVQPRLIDVDGSREQELADLVLVPLWMPLLHERGGARDVRDCRRGPEERSERYVAHAVRSDDVRLDPSIVGRTL